MKTSYRLFVVVIFIQFLFLGILEANAFTNEEILNISNSLQNDMANPTDKWDLTSYISMYFRGRTTLQPKGNESQEKIQDIFKDAYSSFLISLFSKKFNEAKISLDEKLIERWRVSYEKNERNFTDYFTALQENIDFFKNKTIDDTTKQILRFAIILFQFDPEKLDRLMSITGIWPFC